MPVRQYLRGSRRQEGALQGPPLPAWPHGRNSAGSRAGVPPRSPNATAVPRTALVPKVPGHVQPADSPPPRSCLPARGSCTQEPGSRIGGLLTPLQPQAGEGAATPLPRSRRPAPRRSRGPGAARTAGCEAAHTGSLTPRPGPSPTPPAGARAAPEQLRKQPNSPVRSQPPGSHLKTPQTSRLLIGSDGLANGLGPFWPGGRQGNRPRPTPRLNPQNPGTLVSFRFSSHRFPSFL